MFHLFGIGLSKMTKDNKEKEGERKKRNGRGTHKGQRQWQGKNGDSCIPHTHRTILVCCTAELGAQLTFVMALGHKLLSALICQGVGECWGGRDVAATVWNQFFNDDDDGGGDPYDTCSVAKGLLGGIDHIEEAIFVFLLLIDLRDGGGNAHHAVLVHQEEEGLGWIQLQPAPDYFYQFTHVDMVRN